MLANHPRGIRHTLLSSWDALELDVGVAVEVDVLAISTSELLWPDIRHQGSHVKAWDVVAKAPREDIVLLVVLIMVVSKVVADLVAKG